MILKILLFSLIFLFFSLKTTEPEVNRRSVSLALPSPVQSARRLRRRATSFGTTPKTTPSSALSRSLNPLKWPKKIWSSVKTGADVLWTTVWLIFSSEETKDRAAANKTQEILEQLLPRRAHLKGGRQGVRGAADGGRTAFTREK